MGLSHTNFCNQSLLFCHLRRLGVGGRGGVFVGNAQAAILGSVAQGGPGGG